MKMKFNFTFNLPVFLLALIFCPWGRADASAGLAGTVVDPSGAVVPGATVTLQNSGNGYQQNGVTGDDGSYSFAALTPGNYQIRIQAPGFKPYLRSGIAVAEAAQLRVDAVLALDSASTIVEVSAEGSEADLSSTQLGETIAAKKMTSVPLNGRAYTDLLALQAGVVPASSRQPNAVLMSGCTSTSPSGDLNPGNISVSGQRETANGFVVNGANVEETFNMGTAVVPNLDSIQDLRVLTSNFDAQYGNFSGGQVVVTTKSGTNQIHGSGFEFLRNTALDARNYFSQDRATYDQNQFGAALGGPIRKDKVFFFADYQGTRLIQGIDTGLITVPSIQDRSGNLGDLASQLTGQVNGQALAASLSQRLGYTVTPGESYYTSGCTSTAQCVFPNAVIPQSAWSGPAKNLLPYIPAPNQGSDLFSTSAQDKTLRDDKGAVRIDANTRWGNPSAYYFVDDYYLNDPYPTGQGGASAGASC